MILINGPDPICQAERIIGNRPVVGKTVRGWIEAAYTALLAYPYLPVSVSINRINVVENQAVRIVRVVPVMLEMTCSFIKPIKTAAAATDPEITRGIFVNAVDVSAFAECILVALVGNIVGDFARLPIQSIQSAREQACPQNAIGIPINRLDPAGRYLL